MSDEKNGTAGEKRTLIEEGTELKGSLTSKHAMVVMGSVEGEILGPAVIVTETGRVAGVFKVHELRSRGEVAGEIDADVIELGGRVKDKTTLRAKTLEVKLAPEGRPGVAFGTCDIEVGAAPDKAAAIAAATGAARGTAPPAESASADAEATPTPIHGEKSGAHKKSRKHSAEPVEGA